MKLSDSFRRITSTKNYLPEIDGLRFVALTNVVLFHLFGYFRVRFDQSIISDGDDWFFLNTLLINGDRGVQLFFVLSGFILCLPFASAIINKTKLPSLKNYYWRRVTRLEPPYIIAMIMLFVALVVLKPNSYETLTPSLLASLIYVHGWIYHAPSFINVVAWSLEVEVQFYLIAPLLFQIFRLAPLWRRIILILTTGVLLWINFFYLQGYLTLIHQLPYFLIGMLLADWYINDVYADFFNQKWVVASVFILLLLLLYLPIREEFYALMLFPVVLFLFYYSVLKNTIIKRMFAIGWIPIIGGMCYSIYLLHYPIISLIGRWSTAIRIGDYYFLNLMIQFLINGAAILILSALFYRLVERPFMSVKWLMPDTKKQL